VSLSNFPPYRQYSRLLDEHSLTDIVALFLSSEISRRQLNKGDRFPINERDIAKALGVNRQSVNRAWRQLASEGLVKVEHGVGILVEDAQILSLDEATLNAYSEIRMRADMQLARLAARNASEENILAMEEAIKRQAAVAKELSRLRRTSTDSTQYQGLIFKLFLSDLEFHAALRQAARAPWLQTIAEIAEAKTQASRFAGLNSRDWLPRILESHKEIWESIRTHSEENSAKATKNHFETARKSARADR
jgi:DNA-binding FadR family transcriptional regulator